jgi:ABC-2 type transport system permease protein
VVTFTAPILCAYGWCFGAGPLYYLLAAVFLVLVIIPPCTAGLGITLLLVRFLPARRTHQVLLIGALMGSITLIMILRLLQPEKLLTPESTDDLKRLLERMTFPALEYFPSTWATRGLLHAITGETRLVLLNMGRLAALGFIILAAVYGTASRSFMTALSRSSESSGGKKRRRSPLTQGWQNRIFRCLPAPMRSILGKDVRSFIRDTSQWSQLFLLGALVVIYLFNIKILPQDELQLTSMLSLGDFISWLNMGLAGVVLAAVALRFVFPMISMEGRAFWILQASPVPLTPVLWARFLMHLLPMIFLSEILVFVSNIILGADRFIHILSSVLVLLMTVTLTGMAAGLGAMNPRFKHFNQAQIAVSSGGMLYMILSMLYVGVVLAASFRPVYVHFLQRWTGEAIQTFHPIWYYLLILAVSAAGTLIPMIIGAKRLERIEV